MNTKETPDCIYREGCPDPVQCRVAGHCDSLRHGQIAPPVAQPDRAALIERINRAEGVLRTVLRGEIDMVDGINAAVDFLSTITPAEPQWIAVSERLRGPR